MKRLERGEGQEQRRYIIKQEQGAGGQQSISLSDQKGQKIKSTKERERADRKGEDKGRC